MTQLGLGLIGIGRPWPSPQRPVPPWEQVRDLLAYAADLGIRFFDTAPAYGTSEQRLGTFLATLPPQARDRMVTATKCGETWTPEGGSVADHSPAAMAASVARSIDLLGRIDLLQLHQATAGVLADPSVLDTLQRLQQTHGIPYLGASVKDVAACDTALATGAFSHLQMPINGSRPDLVEWARIHHHAVTIIGNRPLESGKAIDRPRQRLAHSAAAVGPGVVLTGTTNPTHLASTLDAWSSPA